VEKNRIIMSDKEILERNKSMSNEDYEVMCIYCRLFLTSACEHKIKENGYCEDYCRTTIK